MEDNRYPQSYPDLEYRVDQEDYNGDANSGINKEKVIMHIRREAMCQQGPDNVNCVFNQNCSQPGQKTDKDCHSQNKIAV
jgi:hypothetical protein